MALLSLRRGTLLAAAAIAGCEGSRAPALSHSVTTSEVAARPAVDGPAPSSSPSSATPRSPAVSATAMALAPTPVPISAVAITKTDDAWAVCHRSYKAAGKDVSKDVASLAKACASQTKMSLVGKTLTGKQADQDKPESFALEARANHCYRVYAQAAESIADLDLAVKDSAGVVVGQDSTDDSSAVVLENGAVCFSKDDEASVVVSVGMGSGAFAVQVWGD